MCNINFFSRELDLIVNEDLRMAVKSYLEDATPDYFWTDGASSSGKYHPAFSQGIGGLVRHTKAVVMFAEELLRMSSYAYIKDEYKDFIIAACLIHDTAKYGISEYDKKAYKDHASNAADHFANYCLTNDFDEPHFLLLNAVKAHMGQWSTSKDDRPFTSVDRCVHLADYLASRSFIDIPSLTADYDSVAAITEDETLPF